MSGTNPIFANSLAQLIFNGVGIPGIAYNDPTAPFTYFAIALHTADPTAAGNQLAFEVAYSPYARVQVPRSPAGWVVTNNVVNPANNIVFPTVVNVGGSITTSILATNFSLGTLYQGSSEILYTAALQTPLSLEYGMQGPPMITSASSFIFG